MITEEMLEGVTKIICHQNSPGRACADGTAAAILLGDALSGREVVFASHGPELEAVQPGPGLLFCDIVPADTNLKDHVAAGAIVLDHHDTRKDAVALFGERGIYGEGMFSGAMLAFEHVWRPVHARYASGAQASGIDGRLLNSRAGNAKHFAILAATRDTWQTKAPLWEKACSQNDAIVFFPWSSWAEISDPFGTGWRAMMAQLELGPILREKRTKAAKLYAAAAEFRSIPNGAVIALINDLDISDVTEHITHGYNIVAGWHVYSDSYSPMLRVSLRSRGGFDVGVIAKRRGGGGHKAAAGFTVPLSRGVDPRELVLACLG